MGLVNSDAGIRFGKVSVDKETGRTKVAQEVNGVDIGTTLEEIKKAKLATTELQKDKVDANTKVIAALDEFKTKLLKVNESASGLSNRKGLNKPHAPNYFNKKRITPSSSNVGDFAVYDSAQTGNYSIKVNQIASFDAYRSYISAPSNVTPAGLVGSFKIGTGDPATQKQINVTNDNSLNDIVNAINNLKDETGITAELGLIKTGTPNNTYEIRLNVKKTGTPIVIEDIAGDILAGWNLVPTKIRMLQSNNITDNSSATANTTNAALNLTGSLKFNATDGVEANIPILATDSIDAIVNKINAATATSNVTATVVPIYAPNALSTDAPISYQIKLETITNTPLKISNSDANILSHLGLDSFVIKSINSSIDTLDATNPGITGHLKIQAGNGAELDIDTAGKSLQQITDEINSQTSTYNLAARLQLIKPANTSGSNSFNVYQLTINTTNNTPLIIENSDATAISGLRLGRPTHDYQKFIAKVNRDGTDYERTDNNISDIIPGVTMSLAAASTVPVSLVVEEDCTAAYVAFTDFMTAYNDLVKFYNKQTAVKSDLSGPAEGADLWDNNYIRNLMTELRRTINTALSVKDNNASMVMSIKSFGVDFNTEIGPNYNTLQILDSVRVYDESLGKEVEKPGIELLEGAFNHKFNAVKDFFTNRISISNSKFTIRYLPFEINSNLSDKNLSISLTQTGGVPQASIFIPGMPPAESNYNLDVMVNNGVYTLIGKKDTPLNGMSFSYVDPVADGQTVTTTINIRPGIMAAFDGMVLDITDETPLPNSDPNKKSMNAFNVKGELLQEIGIYRDKNTKLDQEIQDKKETIEKEMEQMERKFDRVYAAQSKFKEIQSMLAAWNKSNSR